MEEELKKIREVVESVFYAVGVLVLLECVKIDFL